MTNLLETLLMLYLSENVNGDRFIRETGLGPAKLDSKTLGI